jgi:hypothetical protein
MKAIKRLYTENLPKEGARLRYVMHALSFLESVVTIEIDCNDRARAEEH